MASMNARARGTDFVCEKRPATGSRGMVVTNHPLASAAGAEMLLGGGNAIDAAVAALFALTVVEPMMVGILGGGLSHLRLPDGRHVVIDNLSTAPAAARGDMYEPVERRSRDRARHAGPQERGRRGRGRDARLARRLDPHAAALRHAAAATRARARDPPAPKAASRRRNYLHECTRSLAADLAARSRASRRCSCPAAPRSRPARRSCSATMPRHCGASPTTARRRCMAARSDSASPTTSARTAARCRLPILPPTSRSSASRSAAPIAAAASSARRRRPRAASTSRRCSTSSKASTSAPWASARPTAIHLLAEVLKIAFADRAVATADPAFVDVPVARLTSKAYADERRAQIDMDRAQRWQRRPHRRRGVGRHHACHRRRRRRPRRRGDAHHQQPVRRLRADSRHRHDRQQLHVQLRSASGPRAVDRAGQARLHLDGADDGGRGRARAPCARPARRPAHLPVRLPGDRQPDRSRA